MRTIKVIEILPESDKSLEDATRKAIKEANKTLHNIGSIWVQHLNAEVKKGKVVSWRLNCKISFELDHVE